MTADRPRPGIRLTDAEREVAAGRLHAAHGEGRISLDELDERLAVVYGAQVAGDLDPALADIPTDHERELLAEPGGREVQLRPGPAGLNRAGRWDVPRSLLVDQMAGYPPAATSTVTIDFRTAVIRHAQVDLTIRVATFTQLILPPTGSADLSALRGAGPLARTEVPVQRSPGGVHLVVRGFAARRRMVRVTYRPLSTAWGLLTS